MDRSDEDSAVAARPARLCDSFRRRGRLRAGARDRGREAVHAARVHAPEGRHVGLPEPGRERAAGGVLRVVRLAARHHEPEHLHRRGLEGVGQAGVREGARDAVVADERVGERNDLPAVRGIGASLHAPGDPGVEHDLAGRRGFLGRRERLARGLRTGPRVGSVQNPGIASFSRPVGTPHLPQPPSRDRFSDFHCKSRPLDGNIIIGK